MNLWPGGTGKIRRRLDRVEDKIGRSTDQLHEVCDVVLQLRHATKQLERALYEIADDEEEAHRHD